MTGREDPIGIWCVEVRDSAEYPHSSLYIHRLRGRCGHTPTRKKWHPSRARGPQPPQVRSSGVDSYGWRKLCCAGRLSGLTQREWRIRGPQVGRGAALLHYLCLTGFGPTSYKPGNLGEPSCQSVGHIHFHFALQRLLSADKDELNRDAIVGRLNDAGQTQPPLKYLCPVVAFREIFPEEPAFLWQRKS